MNINCVCRQMLRAGGGLAVTSMARDQVVSGLVRRSAVSTVEFPLLNVNLRLEQDLGFLGALKVRDAGSVSLAVRQRALKN